MIENKNLDSLKNEILNIFSNSLSLSSQSHIHPSSLDLVNNGVSTSESGSVSGGSDKNVNININLDQRNNYSSAPIKLIDGGKNYSINLKKNDKIDITKNILGGEESTFYKIDDQLQHINSGITNITNFNPIEFDGVRKIFNPENIINNEKIEAKTNNISSSVNNVSSTPSVVDTTHIQSHLLYNNKYQLKSNINYISNYLNDSYGLDVHPNTGSDTKQFDNTSNEYTMSFITKYPYDFMTNGSSLIIERVK
jgi:hypothetical protein